jgi:hypothetical protein
MKKSSAKYKLLYVYKNKKPQIKKKKGFETRLLEEVKDYFTFIKILSFCK